MLSLNIVPQSLKKEVKLKVIYIKLKNFIQVIIIIIILYLISILISQLILEIHQITIIQETTLGVKTRDNYSRQVRMINGQINFIHDIQAEAVSWSRLLEYIDQNHEKNIEIHQIKIIKKSNQLVINGFAHSRDNLINFKKLLEAAPFLEDINFPISNILKKDNITFEISAKFSNYEFE